MNREQFLAMLMAEFPDVAGQVQADEAGLLHCEVGAVRRATEQALDGGRLWMAERLFLFIERSLRDADPALRNALEVSYLEDLAFGELTAARRAAVRERMPVSLRSVLVRHRPEWQ